MNKGRIIWYAQNLVRESAYNCAMLNAAGNKGEEHSRAVGIYKEACYLLRDLAENKDEKNEAECFIQSTWDIGC
jgi:hypothetical protein